MKLTLEKGAYTAQGMSSWNVPAPRMASAGIGSRWGDWCREVGWLYEVGLLGWDWRRVVSSGREEAEEGETQTRPTFTQYGALGSATCAERYWYVVV